MINIEGQRQQLHKVMWNYQPNTPQPTPVTIEEKKLQLGSYYKLKTANLLFK
jgi:hypothetical protein